MRDYGPVAPSSVRPLVRAALAGVLSAAAGLAVAELVAGLLGIARTPVVAVAEAVVALTPGFLVEQAIQAVGTADKPLLLAGVLLALLGLSALAGVVSLRRRTYGQLLVTALAAVGVAALLTRPQTGPVDVLPGVLGGLTGLMLLPLLVDAGQRSPTDPSAGPVPRRDFLRVALTVAALAGATGAVGRLLGGRRGGVEAARADLELPTEPAALPTGVELGVEGISPWRTPVERFYRIDTALILPLVQPGEWRLRVHGDVDRELDLSFSDLLGQHEVVEAWVTLSCVSNEVGGPLVGNARWTGVRVADVLARAGVRPEADAVRSTSADGWTCGTPLEALTDGRDALLAVAMNGRPLPVEHGFPVRMVVPGLYGFVSATKWLVDLEVTRFDRFAAYWTQRGWAEQAPAKTASRIDVPRAGDSVPSGPVAVGGVAWAQHRGIEAVEVRVDDGPWARARLGGVPSVDTWRQWAWTWEATPGAHRLSVRAVDGDGVVQTGETAGPVPDGATGWHSVEVDVDG